MEIVAAVYEGFVEPLYKKILEQMLPMLITADKREENPPSQKLTPRWVNSLINTSKVR